MTEVEFYARCLAIGMTPAGAAGCCANVAHESAYRANNVEDRSGISDETYTSNVDNGSYQDFPGDAFGYGFAQWTSRDRKTALLSYAKGKGVSIGDPDMQLQFLAREMRQSYPFVWNRLTSSDDPYDCGYVMCKFYEIPADTERQAQARGTLAQEIFRRCSGTAPATTKPGDEEKVTSWPPRMLCKGMNGADVTALQALLVAHGYGMTAVNGVFSDSTDKAVRSYQRDKGLAEDGVAGDNTWAALTAFQHVRR